MCINKIQVKADRGTAYVSFYPRSRIPPAIAQRISDENASIRSIFREQAVTDRPGSGLPLHNLQSVDPGVVNGQAPVQMWTRDTARGPHLADFRGRLNRIPRMHFNFRKMCVERVNP